MYQQTRDEIKRQEIIEKMSGIIDKNRKQFLMPEGWDREFVEIIQLLGYKIDLVEEKILKNLDELST